MIRGIPLLSIALLNAAIGVYVWRHRPAAVANQAFLFLASTISLWTAAVSLAHFSPLDVLFLTRLAFAAAALMPLAILCLFQTFPAEPHLRLDTPSRAFLLSGLLL